MRVYLDASVLTALVVYEEATKRVETAFLSSESEFIVSDFTAAEVASAISRRVRTGLSRAEEGERYLEALDGWVETNATPFVTRSEDVAEAAKLVRRFDLQVKTPDALHLAMTRRARATLWTLDRGMVRVAETLGLSVASPPP